MNKPRNSRRFFAASTILLSVLIAACDGGGNVDFSDFPSVTQQPPVTTTAEGTPSSW